MTPPDSRSTTWTGVVTGAVVFAMLMGPAYLAGRAAGSGSVGDLEDMDIVVPAGIVSLIVASAWGYAGSHLVGETVHRPDRQPRDAWAALLGGGSVFLLGLVLVQGVLFLVAYPDENESLEERNLLIQGTFIGGQILLAAICIGLSRGLLGKLPPPEVNAGDGQSAPASP